MGLFDYFRKPEKNTAELAKERLQVIVAHQRREGLDGPDYLPQLQRELLFVIRKYVHIEDDAVNVQLERDGTVEVLELNVTLPDRENEQAVKAVKKH